jgi:hypothetical protein
VSSGSGTAVSVEDEAADLPDFESIVASVEFSR